MKDVNTINGNLAFGNNHALFYSAHVEGPVDIENSDINAVLNNPYDGDNSLGRRMKDYQHAMIKLRLGKDNLTKDDLAALCELVGTEVPKDQDVEKKLQDNSLILNPFEMGLSVEVTDLKEGSCWPVDQGYIASNVRAGLNFGFDKGLSIRYELTPKK
jgi:hypothetical protein